VYPAGKKRRITYALYESFSKVRQPAGEQQLQQGPRKNMNESRQRYVKISFLIALAYVGVGTICVLPIFNNTALDGDWRVFVIFCTLPVNFVSVAILYAGLPNAIALISVVQVGYFLLFWLVVHRIIRRRAKRREKPPIRRENLEQRP
jgi:hypothetical protein